MNTFAQQGLHQNFERLHRSVCAAHRAQPALLVAAVALHSRQVSSVFDDSPQMGLQLRLVPVFDHGQMVQDLLKDHKYRLSRA